MPQMMPMYWLLLFLFMLMIMYMYISILYFSPLSLSTYIKFDSMKIKSMKKLNLKW
uniref:ATP synthase subunit 8 n=1 Tax=Seladonia aeraria TaxID=1310367 RepID=A0A7T9QQX0_9HYME|nr:ATP synthase F0 subunit 8 [Seladonia aeraria]QQS74771.1 ATP synthase subunit 8 [Seladonia aeraria]